MPDNYIMGHKFLTKSHNAYFKVFVEQGFITGAEAKHDISGFTQYLRDIRRQLYTNGRQVCDISHKDQICADLNNKPVADITEEELKQFFLKEFPGGVDGKTYAELLGQFFSQGPFYYIVSPLNSVNTEREKILQDYVITEGVVSNERESYLYYDKETKKVFYEIVAPSLLITRSSDIQSVKIDGASWKFELTAKGFMFHQAVAFSPIIRDVYAGVKPKNLDAEFERLASMQKPLRLRILDAFYKMFDTSDPDAPARTNLASIVGKPRFGEKWPILEAFLGLPRKGNIGNKVEYVLGGFILSPLKNLIKLAVEFLPAVIENTLAYAADKLTEKFPKHYAARIAVGTAIVCLRVLQGAAFLTRQLVARVTSPIRSAKEAWRIHPVLGVLSGLVTVAAVTGIAIAASPLLVWSGVSAATGWVANLGGLQPAVSYLGAGIAKGAAYLGLAVTSSIAEAAVVVGSVAAILTSAKVAMKSAFAWFTKRRGSVRVDPPAALAVEPPVISQEQVVKNSSGDTKDINAKLGVALRIAPEEEDITPVFHPAQIDTSAENTPVSSPKQLDTDSDNDEELRPPTFHS